MKGQKPFKTWRKMSVFEIWALAKWGGHVQASIIMSYHVSPSCQSMSHHVLSCIIMSYQVSSCLIMSYHVLPCLETKASQSMNSQKTKENLMKIAVFEVWSLAKEGDHVQASIIMSYHVSSSCQSMSHHVLSCIIMSYQVSSCLIMSYHVLPWLETKASQSMKSQKT